jgi:transcriptional pleiotropic regulator of transition state genes
MRLGVWYDLGDFGAEVGMTKIDSADAAEARAVGTARRIDQLGRVVVPAELRKMLGVNAGDLLDFRGAADHIMLFKVQPQCALCRRTERLAKLRDSQICANCLDEIRNGPECAMCGAIDALVSRNGKHICRDCVRELNSV